ncbi:AAA family ATPase [Solirubrobacter sp. CPCC 204708]|uniref:AAA family ATPase n=1 Tax=Solirubrobacter deserti TaxID=2282478 RepID=A0ABT4REV9_9ACTN|nr:LuxR family transcriptional regulator [Solirubrobacter deserti]MBE2318620.1 AAA family ATPase [Solirubrobacter deserti]MDA0137078.1 AAA family ATPase [Solirubrobacter deserti]
MIATVIERDQQRARVAAALDRALDRNGSLVLIEGPAGIGRSTELEAARRAARERGMTVLAARASELEQAFAFGVIRQLFERELLSASADRRAALLSDAAVLAAPALGLDGKAPAVVDAPFSVLHGLHWLAAGFEPVLLAVDDAHLADPASLRALLYLATRLEGQAIAIVVTVRSGERAPLLDELTVAADTVVPLPPLSTEGIAAFLGAPELVAAAERATGGIPFLLEEFARAPAETSRTLMASVLLRLARLPAAATAVARAVAVLDGHAELRHVAALAQVPDAPAAVEALVEAGFLKPGRPLGFAQTMVRGAVREQMTHAERADLHARAATLLRAAGLRPELVAPHLLATEPAGDAEVVRLLRAAATRALHQGAPETAREYLRRALREPPEPGTVGEILSALGEAEWCCGEDLEAATEHLREALARTPDPKRRPARALALHQAIFVSGRLVEAYELLEREIELARGAADPEDVWRMEAALSSIGLLNPATVGRANGRLARFEQLEGATPGEGLQLANVACWKWAAGTAAETVEHGRRALADARAQAADALDSIPIYEALWVLTYADAHELALEVLEDTLADARARGSVFGVSTSCALRALIAWQRGDVTAAEQEARTAAVLPGLSAFVRPPLFGTLALALVARGDLEGAERAIAESGCGPSLPEFVCLNPAFYARGVLRAAQGRYDEALADFTEFGERSARIRLRNPGDPWRLGAADCLRQRGAHAEASRLVDEQLELARRWGTASALGVALHAHALAHGSTPDALRAAADVLADSPARLEHARCLVDLGGALRRTNQRAAAREPLREGLELARRCGADALVRRAHDELVVAGGRPRRLMFSGPEALTPSERRVAELAASGHSNREIAQLLFVTTKTVDNHLARAYSKLGISSRGELAGALQSAVEELA